MASVGDVDNTLTYPLWILIGPALIQGSWPSHFWEETGLVPYRFLPQFHSKMKQSVDLVAQTGNSTSKLSSAYARTGHVQILI